MRPGNREFFDKHKDDRPYHAESPTTLDPSKIDWPDIVAVPLRQGVRTWMFRTAQERDAFCTKFGARRV